MKLTTIDTYIATFPPEVRSILQKVRATIRKAAPKATESISYQIPAFHLNGQYLIYFAGFKKHVGVYPVHSVIPELKDVLTPYLSGKATAKLMLDKPIPYGLITKIVRAKVKSASKNGAHEADRSNHAKAKAIAASRRHEAGKPNHPKVSKTKVVKTPVTKAVVKKAKHAKS